MVLSRIGKSRLGRKVAVPLLAMGLASQMQADRQTERHQDDISARSLEDMLGPGDDKAFLEEKHSYAESKETGQSEWTAKQKAMNATRRQLLLPGGESAEAHQESLTRDEVERPGRERTDEESADITGETPSNVETDQERGVAERTRQVTQAQQRDRQARDTKKAEQDKIASGRNFVQDTKKIYTTFRQAAEGMSGVGIIWLIVELNVQCLLTIFKIKNPILTKASKPKVLFTCCLDCTACISPLFWCLFPLIIVLLLLGALGGVGGFVIDLLGRVL